MSWRILATTLYQRRTALLWYCIGLISYSAMIVWYYPQMASIDFQQLLEAYPSEMLDFFAGGAADMSTLGGFLSVEYLGFMWVLIIAAAAITFATKSLSSEVAAGTMELLLAQPVDRRVLVLTRWFAMAIYLGVLMLSTTVPIYATARLVDTEIDPGNLVVLTAVGFLLSLAIGSIAFALSSVSRESGKPASILGGVLAAMWILGFMSANAKWADAFEPVNLFHYWDPSRLLERGTADASTWWFYGSVAALGLVFALLGFARRDIA